jgi:phospholipase C
MRRREFLKTSAAVGAAVLLGDALPALARRPPRIPGGSMLDLSAAQAPLDTIVVLMMENRSFDHYLGWLGSDEQYLETGRSLYGRRFGVRAQSRRFYKTPEGARIDTFPLTIHPDFANPYRGCGFGDPGHGWNAGRAERDGGFLAAGSGNDRFALGYYVADDLPFYSAIARRFTVFDRYHASLLGPTFPNREYLHSGESGGLKNNAFPQQVGYPEGFTWPTIWDRLLSAGVPARYYYSDLPVTALWGPRLASIASPIANYFEDAAAGRLANVVFLDPGFIGESQTDEHPLGDVRQGQRFVWQCVKAFVESSHWARGVMLLTYDEWGGFFDHVRPPHFPDDRASRVDEDDFGQAGFRVPTRMLSPYARRNFVDHGRYDHTSILRFIEWRFLGAPAHGAGRTTDGWFLTKRDRHARNIGISLRPGDPEPEFDVGDVSGPPLFSPACAAEGAVAADTRARTLAAARPMNDFERGLGDGYWEQLGVRRLPTPLRLD